MAAPIWGEPPKIRQEGASLVVYDHASWFTQDSGDHVTRYVHVWLWNGANIFNTPEPPTRTESGVLQPGENSFTLPLGPTNVGGHFEVVEYGGIDGTVDGGRTWVEWGRENSATRIPRAPVSNMVIVQPWENVPPPPPPPPASEAQLLIDARDATRELVQLLRRQGKSWAEVKAHKYGHAYYNDLGGK